MHLRQMTLPCEVKNFDKISKKNNKTLEKLKIFEKASKLLYNLKNIMIFKNKFIIEEKSAKRFKNS